MTPYRKRRHWQREGALVLTALIACWAFPSGAASVSTFGVLRQSGQLPAVIHLDDIWFYDEVHSRQIPEISLEWVAAAFDTGALKDPSAYSFGTDGDFRDRLRQRARGTKDGADER